MASNADYFGYAGKRSYRKGKAAKEALLQEMARMAPIKSPGPKVPFPLPTENTYSVQTKLGAF